MKLKKDDFYRKKYEYECKRSIKFAIISILSLISIFFLISVYKDNIDVDVIGEKYCKFHNLEHQNTELLQPNTIKIVCVSSQEITQYIININ